MVGSDLSKSEILKELLGKKHINGSDLAFRLRDNQGCSLEIDPVPPGGGFRHILKAERRIQPRGSPRYTLARAHPGTPGGQVLEHNGP